MKLLFKLIISILIVGCSSPVKLLNSGQYEAAIYKSAKKLRRNKSKEKHIKVLEESYRKANEEDERRVARLKGEGRPDCWDDVFSVYHLMDSRQQIIRPLLPLKYKNGKEANFIFVDYNEEIKNSRQRAAEYLYVSALKLLDSKNKMDARKAFAELEKIGLYYDEYKDVKQLKEKAHLAGITYVLMGVKNNSKEIMPVELDEELRKLPISELNTFWTQYHNKANKEYNYDYTIVIDMKSVLISPEQVSENNYKEEKEIQDGWQYLFDKNGNVKKDSLGNDIKVPKFVKVGASVKEVHQFKKASILGTLDYYNNNLNQLIKSENLVGDNLFENHTATFFGDERALTPETKKKLGAPPKPFPNNAAMVFNAGMVLKEMCKKIVFNNRGVIN
jgi:hypothetical protein